MKKSRRKIVIFSAISTLAGLGLLGASLPFVFISKDKNTIQNAIYNPTSKLSLANNSVAINGLNYTLDSTTYTATVNGYTKLPQTLTSLSIPQTIVYNGMDYDVTSVSNSAFFNSNISSLTLPTTLTTIGTLAFANNFISSLTIPANVTSIGDNAFSNNMFHYGTVVYLPLNCTWNKHYGYSPFDTNNNYTKFTPVVQFVIQGSSVYTYNDNQGGWVVTSYMPKQITNQTELNAQLGYAGYSGYGASDFASPIDTGELSNPSFGLSEVSNTNNPSEEIAMATNLSQTIIYFNGPSGNGVSAFISFDTSKMQLVYHINDPNAALYSNGSAGRFYFSIYSPSTKSYSITPQWINSSESVEDFGKLFNNIDFSYGDIVTFINLPGNTSASGYYNTDFLNIGTNWNSGWGRWGLGNNINALYLTDDAWSGHTNSTYAFRITPIGLVPYVNTNKVNPLQVIGPSTTSFSISGITTPNTQVTAIFKTYTMTVNSNDLGNYTINFSNVGTLSLGQYVTIESGSSPAYFVYLKGQNPLGTWLYGTINGHSFGITFNGIINGFDLWYQDSNRFFAQYDSYYEAYSNSTLNLNQSLTFEGSISFQITREINNKSSVDNYSYNFNQANVTFATFKTWLNTIPLTGMTKLEITMQGSNTSINRVYSNNGQISYGWNNSNGNQYLFDYSLTNGLTNAYIPVESLDGFDFTNWNNTTNTMLGNSTSINYYLTNYALFGGGQSGSYGTLYVGGWSSSNKVASNFYDPTPMMYSLVHELTNGLTNPYEKAWAIEHWVNSTFTYSKSGINVYGMTIAQEFSALKGICGDYSNMSAVLLSLDGFITRVVTGSVDSPTLLDGDWGIDHAWTQVWFPSYGEWLTLDPTFGWFNNPGNMHAKFSLIRRSQNVSIMFFPPYETNNQQSLIMNYFANYPWQMLNNFGNFFGIPQGGAGAFDNPNVAGSLGLLILNQASEMANVSKGNYSGYTISPNNWQGWNDPLNPNT